MDQKMVTEGQELVSEDDLKALGVRLREIRGVENLNAADMANLWGLERKTWERYEHGDSALKVKVLMGLARMGYNETWLLTGEGDMDAANVREVRANARANAADPAATRVVAFNVAYLFAAESKLIDLDPEDFAIAFRDLFDELLKKPEDQAEQVVSFALQRLLHGADGSS